MERSIEERNKAVLRRWYDEMFADQRWELMPELAGPRYTRHESTGTFTVTVEDHAKRLSALYGERARANVSSYRLFAEGDMVCVIGTFKGYRQGGADQEVYNWVQAFRLENGKIVETWWPGYAKNVEW